MKTSFSRLTPAFKQIDFYEYRVSANIDDYLQQKIDQEKERLHSGFGITVRPKKARMSIARFKAREPMEETLIRYIRRICDNQPAFQVTLNNFGGMPPGKIYLRVLDQNTLKLLSTSLLALNSYIQSCSCSPLQLVSRMGITIAGHVSEQSYLPAMLDCSQRIFDESFFLHELVLLRRANHYSQWEVINVFHLAETTDITLIHSYEH